MPDTASAFWTTAPGRGEIRHEPLRPPDRDEALVRTRYSGISRGTEALVFLGRVPSSEWQRMRAPFQAGDFPAPVKYGYANVGVVEVGPDDLKGRTVFALFPHQTRYVLPVAALHVLPEGVPPGRAVLAANLETAVNGLWDARPHIGDRVTVIGGGAVGCMVAWLAAGVRACDVELVDVNEARRTTAAALGVRFSTPDQARAEADLVVHASGTAEGLALALEVAGPEATIVEMSWYGDREIAVPLGAAFHSRRLTLAASQVGAVARGQRARWDTRRRMALALSLLADPALDALITGESRFDELPDTMRRLATSPGDTICHRIDYGGADGRAGS
ncbi:MAG: zinc-binding alcohol dehydrogenase [Vicinamibacterales bacterium]